MAGVRRAPNARWAVVLRIVAAVALVAVVAGSVVLVWPRSDAADGLTVTRSTTTSLSLRWTGDPDAEAYRVSIATDRSMKKATVHHVTGEVTTIDGLEQGTRYWIRVAPIRHEVVDRSDQTRVVSARTETIESPTWVGDPDVDTTSAKLDWTDIDGAKAYVVEAARTEEFADPVGTTIRGDSAGTVNELDSDQIYWLRVAVARDDGGRIGGWSEPIAITTLDNAIRAGTFNISGVHNDKTGQAPRWRQRRPVVVQQIHDADLDVVGLQEVSTVDSGLYRRNLVSGNSQFADLVNGLNDAGGQWRATNTSRGATNDTRIAYRSDRLELVSEGGRRFASQVNENKRYFAWAVFKVKATGRTFLFVTTHLTPRSQSVREKQWRELLNDTRARADGMPVIVGGDFNSSKFHMPAGRMLTAMKTAGFGDVLGQQYRSTTDDRARAEKLVRANIGSFNNYKRSLSGYGKGRIGNSVDYIFASNDLKVREFRLVANVNDKGAVVGTLPSDHYLLTATVEID